MIFEVFSNFGDSNGSSIENERHLSLDLISSKLTLCNVDLICGSF